MYTGEGSTEILSYHRVPGSEKRLWGFAQSALIPHFWDFARKIIALEWVCIYVYTQGSSENMFFRVSLIRLHFEIMIRNDIFSERKWLSSFLAEPTSTSVYIYM